VKPATAASRALPVEDEVRVLWAWSSIFFVVSVDAFFGFRVV
jgi:hypothetical protein